MKTLLKAWAIGMAIIIGLGTFCFVWQTVFIPLFEQYVAIRALVGFIVISLIALLFGGIVVGSRDYDDFYPVRSNDGDGSEEHF